MAGKGTAPTMEKGLLAPEMMSFTIVSIILCSLAVALLITNLSVNIPTGLRFLKGCRALMPGTLLLYNKLREFYLVLV